MSAVPEQADVVVLGNGPTGVLASHLALDMGRRVVLVSSRPLQSLELISADIADAAKPAYFSLLPIFPVYGDNYVNHILARSRRRAGIDATAETVWTEDELEFRHAFSSGALDNYSSTDAPGSFAAYASAAGYNSLPLARKQYGRDRVLEPLTEVRRKIERNYVRPQVPLRRVGYCDGASPYVKILLADLERIPLIQQSAVKVHAPSRTIFLAGGRRLKYNQLIACLSVLDVAALLGLAPPEISYCPAHFAVAHVTQDAMINTMVYDYRQDSPIVRAAVPTEGLCVAQLSPDAYADLSSDPIQVGDWISELLDTKATRIEQKTWTVRVAYPLEGLQAEWLANAHATMRLANATLFGRFAQWQYRDLHELDWVALENVLG